jgi:hypothetical protein
MLTTHEVHQIFRSGIAKMMSHAGRRKPHEVARTHGIVDTVEFSDSQPRENVDPLLLMLVAMGNETLLAWRDSRDCHHRTAHADVAGELQPVDLRLRIPRMRERRALKFSDVRAAQQSPRRVRAFIHGCVHTHDESFWTSVVLRSRRR